MRRKCSRSKILVRDYAFVAAGQIFAHVNRLSDAMKAFDRALAIQPDAYIYINCERARPYSDRAGRLADLDAALKLQPGDPDALVAKAELLSHNGELGRAIELYTEAAKSSDPDLAYIPAQRAIFFTGLAILRKLLKSCGLSASRRSILRISIDYVGTKVRPEFFSTPRFDDCHDALPRTLKAGRQNRAWG